MSLQQKSRSNHKGAPSSVQLAEDRVQGGRSAQHSSDPSSTAKAIIQQQQMHITDETASRVPGSDILRQTQRVVPGNIQRDRSEGDRQQGEVVQGCGALVFGRLSEQPLHRKQDYHGSVYI